MSDLLTPFEPCCVVYDEAGCTEYVYEDVPFFARNLEGSAYTVEWLLAVDDKRLVGLRIWSA